MRSMRPVRVVAQTRHRAAGRGPVAAVGWLPASGARALRYHDHVGATYFALIDTILTGMCAVDRAPQLVVRPRPGHSALVS